MFAKTVLKKALLDWTGYRVFKHKYLPTGWDLAVDLKEKIRLPMNTIFDVGANVGETTLKFKRSFPQATTWSFEPVAATFAELQKNIVAVPGTKAFKLALGDEEGTTEIKVYTGKESVLNSLNEDSMNKGGGLTESITIRAGDNFCHENNIPEIDLLKIDTEGYEIRVLKGFSHMISSSKIKAIYCEVGFNPNNRRNTFVNELIDFTYQNKFQLYGLYEVSNIQLKAGNNYGNMLFLSYDTTGKMK